MRHNVMLNPQALHIECSGGAAATLPRLSAFKHWLGWGPVAHRGADVHDLSWPAHDSTMAQRDAGGKMSLGVRQSRVLATAERSWTARPSRFADPGAKSLAVSPASRVSARRLATVRCQPP